MDSVGVKAWRRAQRERLIAERMAVAPAVRRQWAKSIAAGLRETIADRPGLLGVYWPFRAEFDPRPLIDWAIAAGRAVALPVVIDKKGPLEYRSWRPGEPLVDGVWNIPIPEKREIVVPEIVLAPLVGFDAANYRLGYGGGYFDRTLAALMAAAGGRGPLAIGVGFELQRLDTIHPQPIDVAMDLIVTEAGIHRGGPASPS